MKKYLIVLAIPFTILGCSFLPEKDTTEKPRPKPAVRVESGIDLSNFYFNAGETGLVLLSTDDDDFSAQLSDKEIGEANISDGILMFTELLDEGENVRVINLKAYAESLEN